MTDLSAKALKANRVRAYNYIVNYFQRKVNWNPPINSDNGLANFFDVSIDTIKSLKNGNVDPPEKVVMQFKQLLKDQTYEEAIDNYLVIPFTSK
ncbi:MAG: hypothetical protein WC541_00790 [Dehalococcoidia bacterium]